MGPLELVQLTALMDRPSGRAKISVGLIDGPVLFTHPELTSENIREVPGKLLGAGQQFWRKSKDRSHPSKGSRQQYYQPRSGGAPVTFGSSSVAAPARLEDRHRALCHRAIALL